MSAERRLRGSTRVLNYCLPVQGTWVSRFVSYSALSTQLSALLLLAACAIPQVPSETVYEDPVNFVRLERDPHVLEEAPYTKHTHPLLISSEDMAIVLRGLSVKQRQIALQLWLTGEAPREPALTQAEIALLAPKLAEALGRADPNERVSYYLSRPETSIKRVITSGGMYVEDHELHVILSNHRIVYGIPAYGMVYDRRYPMRPTAAKGFDLFFEPAEAVVPQQWTWWDRILGQEEDELVISLVKLGITRSVASTEEERLRRF